MCGSTSGAVWLARGSYVPKVESSILSLCIFGICRRGDRRETRMKIEICRRGDRMETRMKIEICRRGDRRETRMKMYIIGCITLDNIRRDDRRESRI